MSKSTLFGSSGKGQRVELAIRPHRAWPVQVLLVLWRWSFELCLAIALVVVYLRLTESMRPVWALVLMATPLAVALAVPWSRRQLLGWFWCTVTRHRLRALFVAVRMTNYHGKLPWLLLVKPTPVGERALCLMVAGLSLNDLEDRTEAIASTCIARDARVTRSKRFAPLVWIDVIRRDPLAASKPLVSVLLAKAKTFGRLHTDPNTPAPGLAAVPTRLVEPIPSAFTPAAAPAQRNPIPDGPVVVVVHGEDLSDYV